MELSDDMVLPSGRSLHWRREGDLFKCELISSLGNVMHEGVGVTKLEALEEVRDKVASGVRKRWVSLQTAKENMNLWKHWIWEGDVHAEVDRIYFDINDALEPSKPKVADPWGNGK